MNKDELEKKTIVIVYGITAEETKTGTGSLLQSRIGREVKENLELKKAVLRMLKKDIDIIKRLK